MILRKSSLLPVLLSAGSSPALVAAYFAQVSNAHVEFVAGAGAGAVESAETVDDRPSLRHGGDTAGLWSALEGALDERSELGFRAPAIMGLFESWAEAHGREYRGLAEKSRRMLVWLENHVLIERHNAGGTSSYTLGHNEYSDLTHAEFRERMKLGEFSAGLTIPEEGRKTFNFMELDEPRADSTSLRGVGRGAESAVGRRGLAAEDEEDAEDWHGRGLMGPIRNQGTCGACWAFSAAGAIESAMAINKYKDMTPSERENLAVNLKSGEGSDLGLVVPLSEQNLIDCDVQFEKGCDGGLMTTDFEEEEHKKGICTEADYPYLQTKGTCSADMCTPVPGSVVKNHVDIVPRKNNALKQALKVAPVTAAMVATDPTFQFYKGGIYAVEGCGKVTKEWGDKECKKLYEGQDVCLPDINHGVLVVGYGRDEDATTDVKTFFKVKNSWGEGWGEGGYFRLARGETDKTDPKENWGECAILTLLSFPVME